MKIKVLSEDTINKIAAGEVIERPASIVKELVENSIDAGSTKIDIEVKAGGKNLIRVIDNGCGMDKDDAILAFQRHATSKIDTADDLTRIGTLGFRGEALPSISAVSKTEMITRTKDMDSAVRVRIEGGKVLEVKETGAPCGTMVNVQNLFFNTPARRKFLKTNITEMSHIISTVSNYALINTNCGFSLVHNDENIMEIFPKDNLLDRIRILYGNEIAEGLLELNFEKDGIKIKGYAGKPILTQPNRSKQIIFVNKRPIVNRMIGYAIYEAYNTLIPKDRFPVIFLFIEISPESIDVNVHPTKKEIKFGDDRFIREIAKESILNALGVKETVSAGQINRSAQETPGFAYTPSYNLPDSWSAQVFIPQAENYKAVQINNAYIIHEVSDGFEIMDQHAVGERIQYEKIKLSLEKKSTESQRLLIPINIELTADEEKILKKEIPFFNEIGFNIDEFGNRTVIIDMIPAIMDNADIKTFIKDVLSEIKELGKAVSHDDVKDDIIKMMACRSAVKQGDALNNMEIQRLIKDWQETKLPYTCPHGRPAVIRMSREELDKQFHRT